MKKHPRNVSMTSPNLKVFSKLNLKVETFPVVFQDFQVKLFLISRNVS